MTGTWVSRTPTISTPSPLVWFRADRFRSVAFSPPGTGEGEPGCGLSDRSRKARSLSFSSSPRLRLRGEHLVQVRGLLSPPLRLPDLDPIAGTEHDDVVIETGERSQRRRQGDPPLPVWDIVVRSGVQPALVSADIGLVGRTSFEPGIEAVERLHVVDGETALLHPGHHDAIGEVLPVSLIHISEPTRLGMISYAVFCLKKK